MASGAGDGCTVGVGGSSTLDGKHRQHATSANGEAHTRATTTPTMIQSPLESPVVGAVVVADWRKIGLLGAGAGVQSSG